MAVVLIGSCPVAILQVAAVLQTGKTMRLDLKGRIAKWFNQIFFVGDTARRGQHRTVIQDVTNGLDVPAHTVFVITKVKKRVLFEWKNAYKKFFKRRK